MDRSRRRFLGSQNGSQSTGKGPSRWHGETHTQTLVEMFSCGTAWLSHIFLQNIEALRLSDAGSYLSSRMNPVAGRSGLRNVVTRPAVWVTASAARYPLRTAPSIVAGQPVAIQSPARKIRGHWVFASGRNLSSPGRTA